MFKLNRKTDKNTTFTSFALDTERRTTFTITFDQRGGVLKILWLWADAEKAKSASCLAFIALEGMSNLGLDTPDEDETSQRQFHDLI